MSLFLFLSGLCGFIIAVGVLLLVCFVYYLNDIRPWDK